MSVWLRWYGFVNAENARVMVLAATNLPSELDEAILRRLPQAFEIGIPDCRERAEILKVILKDVKVEDDIDYDHVAGLCDGYTGSDLIELCKTAAYFPIRDLLNDEKNGNPSLEPRPLSLLDLEKVISTTTKIEVAASECKELSCPIVQPPMVIHTARTDLDFHDQEQMKAEPFGRKLIGLSFACASK
ncbi:P-loop containing nucleoside triphosphate hydrolase superfamily protein [Forsythia ovata]|uniref:P-loop containing nucleoside triphosphate hydrolase superfamily protein n=1 Tax=Forsythia ovata TaxID=205694 RepID=A0ABD1X9X9_9LAMI